MSKAEERAKERYWLEPNNIETQEKYAAYVEGYHQAEKDLELSWEDIKLIDSLIDDVSLEETDTMEDLYHEVLRRFKDLKMK